MGQVTPIILEDGTTIYIEAIDNTSTTPSAVVPNNPTTAGEEPKRGGVWQL